jgi:NADPH-dependent 2,4-dienoyl-CoA reductase/sulfur reductase-like enzyme
MPPRPVDVLLVGGGVAAARCARTLRRRGFTGSILLVGDEPRAPYNRPPLSKELLRGEVPDALVAVEPDAWYTRRGVELATGTAVTALDPRRRIAELHPAVGRETTVRFEHCLIATGAEPARPPVPGARLAHLLRTLPDAQAIRRRAVPGAPAAVIGGGFIGVEVAASLAERGLRVTLLERERELWGGGLGRTLSAWGEGVLAGRGVAVRLGARVSRIEPDEVTLSIAGTGGERGERIRADLVVAGVGVRPREALATASGLETGDGILVDERQATSAGGVFAAGDVARPRGGVRVEHWHAARETGERAALAMLGEVPPARRAPWIYSDFGGAHLDVVGLVGPGAGAGAQERVLGDPSSGRFAVAWSGPSATLAGVAIAGGALAPEDARRLVEAAAPVEEAERLIDA